MATSLNDNLPEVLKRVRTQPLFVIRLDVRKLLIVGATPGAYRRIGVVAGEQLAVDAEAFDHCAHGLGIGDGGENELSAAEPVQYFGDIFVLAIEIVVRPELEWHEPWRTNWTSK
jgi:hypothetical protein